MPKFGLSEMQEELLKKNIIDIAGDVDEEMAFYIRKAIMFFITKGSPPIDIYISSRGGSVDRGLDIYDMLKLYTGKKKGIVVGLAASMAAVILQACEERKATVHAEVLIHHISRRDVKLDIMRDKEKLYKEIKSMEENQSFIYNILSLRTKKKVNVIKEECAKDESMTAQNALKFGLIDQII